MRGVDHAHAFRHIIDVFDKDCALLRQLIHYKAVVDDFLANIDGSAKGFKRDPDDIHRSHHAGAEPTRLEEHNPFCGIQIGSRMSSGGGFDRVRSHNP